MSSSMAVDGEDDSDEADGEDEEEDEQCINTSNNNIGSNRAINTQIKSSFPRTSTASTSQPPGLSWSYSSGHPSSANSAAVPPASLSVLGHAAAARNRFMHQSKLAQRTGEHLQPATASAGPWPGPFSWRHHPALSEAAVRGGVGGLLVPGLFGMLSLPRPIWPPALWPHVFSRPTSSSGLTNIAARPHPTEDNSPQPMEDDIKEMDDDTKRRNDDIQPRNDGSNETNREGNLPSRPTAVEVKIEAKEGDDMDMEAEDALGDCSMDTVNRDRISMTGEGSGSRESIVKEGIESEEARKSLVMNNSSKHESVHLANLKNSTGRLAENTSASLHTKEPKSVLPATLCLGNFADGKPLTFGSHLTKENGVAKDQSVYPTGSSITLRQNTVAAGNAGGCTDSHGSLGRSEPVPAAAVGGNGRSRIGENPRDKNNPLSIEQLLNGSPK